MTCHWQEVDLRSWREMIGYVPQETLLLHDTVLINVTLGDPELNEEDAEYALRAAGAWEFVTAMPQGMHSTVGERGGGLSGGQSGSALPSPEPWCTNPSC